MQGLWLWVCGVQTLWPQQPDQRCGFGWLKPRARWQLPRMMNTCQLRCVLQHRAFNCSMHARTLFVGVWGVNTVATTAGAVMRLWMVETARALAAGTHDEHMPAKVGVGCRY